jgi:hypothetical protein
LIHNKQPKTTTFPIHNKAFFSVTLEAKVGNTLAKVTVLRINLNVDGAQFKNTYSPITLVNL